MRTITFAELAVCSNSGCSRILRIEDMVRDEQTDDPYCSLEHLAEAIWTEFEDIFQLQEVQPC